MLKYELLFVMAGIAAGCQTLQPAPPVLLRRPEWVEDVTVTGDVHGDTAPWSETSVVQEAAAHAERALAEQYMPKTAKLPAIFSRPIQWRS